MIQDYENKAVLAEMRRQVNDAAKESEREARITFVLIHTFSAHHELMENAGKPDGENNQFRFFCWCLNTIADEMESENSPLASYRKEKFPLRELARWRTPAKDAGTNGLEEWQEWPKDVPYEEWLEEEIRKAYMTLFGLYYWNTPVKDLMRWVGKNEPRNPKFVNAMNATETITNIEIDQLPENKQQKKPKQKMYVSDEEMARGYEQVYELQKAFAKLYGQLAKGDTLRFCKEKEETAFGIFMSGTFTMMMPGKEVNREAMTSSENYSSVYQAAKRYMIGEKLLKEIVTNDDDKAACEVFHWGMVYGKMGISNGEMPTGLADMDIRRKPGPKTDVPTQ